jgi:hypothetical protein
VGGPRVCGERSCGWMYPMLQPITCSSTYSPQLPGRTVQGVACGDGGGGSSSQCISRRSNLVHPWRPHPCCHHEFCCWFVRRSCNKKAGAHMHSLQTFCTFSRSSVAVGKLRLVKKWIISRAALVLTGWRLVAVGTRASGSVE